jgi:DNA repair protein RadC
MYLIKDLPENERPRERLLAQGASSLSTYELIAIVLQSGSKEFSALEVAKAIIRDTNDLSDLKDLTIPELTRIRGIGPAKAIGLMAAIELGKRVYSSQSERMQIRSPKDVFLLLGPELMDLKQEVLTVLFLDLKTQLIAKKIVFIGSLNQSLVHPREVFRFAVKYSAYQLILVHNHPSGDPEPSLQDIEVTKRFIDVGEMMQIHVVDHVIIGKHRYVSVMDYLRTQKKASHG